jgi:nucleotide-binding universal stress UspA family protein
LMATVERTDMAPTIICVVEKRTAEAVIATAGGLARDLGARVVLAHIRPEPVLNSPDRTERARALAAARGREILHQAVQLLPSGVDTDERVELGGAVEQLSAIADERRAALIVIGSHHRPSLFSTRRATVSRKLAREAPCPVVIVSQSERPQASTVIAGVDGTDRSARAALFARELANDIGDRLLLVHSHDSLEPVTIHAGGAGEAGVSVPEPIWDALGHSGNGAGLVVGGAPPAHALQAVAARENARLIVIGAGSDDGAGALLRGSVAAQLPRLAPCPVVVVPDRASQGLRQAATTENRLAA